MFKALSVTPIVFGLLVLLGTISGIRAQVGAGSSAFDEVAAVQPTISEVRIEFDGVPAVSEQFVRNNLQVKAGQEYDQSRVDLSIRSLYRTGLFEYVETDLERTSEEAVVVTFKVRPRFKVEAISIRGNSSVSTRRLRREMNTEPEQFLDELRVKNDTDQIKEFYLKKGFANVAVDYEVVRDRVRGTCRVVIEVDEGRKMRIADITFEGNDSFADREIKAEMKTSEWWLFSWLTGGGKFDEDQFAEDLDSIRVLYKNLGFLDVNLDEDAIRFEYPKPHKMRIVIPIEEGRQYRVGEIDIVGNTIYTDDELRPFIAMRRGFIFSPETLDEDREALTDYYGSRGYLDTQVRAERVANLETRRIDVNYVVRESEKFFVESINIQGNTKTKSIVILRELALSPGDVFDLVRMKTSQSRLENTRFFEQGGVNLAPEPTNIPGRRNLRVSVQEGRTGNLTFGAGFSSLERATLFAEITQGNFDLFNRRSLFQGDGQKFRLRFQIGSQSNQVSLSFEEPWLFEQRLAFGFEAFRSETDFVSTSFNELRTGFEVYLRRRLFELVEGRVSYRFEIVDIKDVSPFASPIIRAEAGKRSVSKVGLVLLRDTRNDLLFPTRGMRIQTLTEVAGGPLAGETEYVKLEFRGSKFWKTFDFFEQTFFILARAGTAWPYGDEPRLPFFDRFFLGGPQTLRGFDFREVGPRDAFTLEPTGGDSYGFFSAEYVFKIADPLRVAVFYDAGFVNEEDFDFSVDDYNDNWGIGLRMMIMGSPMRLDYGIPITSDNFNDDGAQFNFTFGSRF